MCIHVLNVQVFNVVVCFIPLEYIFMRGIPMLYSKCIFNIRTAKLFSKVVSPFYIPVPVSPYPGQHMILSVFQIIAVLVDEMWYFTVVLICFTLVANGVEHLFIYLTGHLYIFGEMSIQIYFNSIICLFIVEFSEFFMHSG